MGKQNRRRKTEKKKSLPKTKNELNNNNNNNSSNNNQEHGTEFPRKETLDEVTVGDRVWVRTRRTKSDLHSCYRCIVKSLGDSSSPLSEHQYTFLPLDHHVEEASAPTDQNHNGDNETTGQTFEAGPHCIVRKDPNHCTLRFNVDEHVVAEYDGSWVAATVDTLFPGTSDFVYCYSCELDDGPGVIYPKDTALTIVRRPLSFRLAVGERVIFSTAQAKGLNNVSNNRSHPRGPWMVGEISQVDVLGRKDFYAVYEISFTEYRKRQTCFILQDIDEHVASVNTTPRKRLMDAIEQDCDYRHIDYIIKSSKLDVKSFLDVVIDKAIQSACYGALLFLQRNGFESFSGFRDDEDTGLLHQISRSANADRYFQRASAIALDCYVVGAIHVDDPLELSLDTDLEACNYDQHNIHGKIWLHALVESGNTRALDFVLSPERGYLFTFYQIFWEEEALVDDLMALARSGRNHLVVEMLEKAVKFAWLRRLYDVLFCFDEEETIIETVDHLSKRYCGSSHLALAKRLIRFCCELESYHFGRDGVSLENLLHNISRDGKAWPLRWLVEADKRLLYIPLCTIRIANPDPFEQFVQSEMYTHTERIYLDLMLSLAERKALGPYSRPNIQSSLTVQAYADILQQYAVCSNEDESLASFIAKKRPKQFSELRCLIDYKLQQLQDDENLDDRLKVLDFLVKDNGREPPGALDCVRWHQCGVLRWLVKGGIVDLQSLACEQQQFFREEKKLLFLGGRRIPASMSTGAFLFFSAIEFDDPQTLLWLIGDDQEVSDLSGLQCHGWNAAHACAYFGRVEIVLSLRSMKSWPALVQNACGRKPRENTFAVHLAIENGFTLVADLLLSSGSRAVDGSGNQLGFYTKRSTHVFVRRWGAEKEKPLALRNDIEKLYQLLAASQLDVAAIKKHVVDTRALDIARWRELDYNSGSLAGPLREKYIDIVEACFRIADPGFVCWLGCRLSPRTEEQLRTWSQFSPVKPQGVPVVIRMASLSDIKQSVEEGSINLTARDKGGLLFTHVAAAYDRADVLEWLVTDQGMSLDAQDGSRRTAIQVAVSSTAVSVVRWITEYRAKKVLSSLILIYYRQHVARRQRRRCLCSIVSMQALYRGIAVRRWSRGLLMRRLKESQLLHSIWNCIPLLDPQDSRTRALTSWTEINEQHNHFVRASDSECGCALKSETTKKLDNAAKSALNDLNQLEHEVAAKENDGAEFGNEDSEDPIVRPDTPFHLELGEVIRYTSEVEKWLKHGDTKYRQFFIRRLLQLKAGERSRILAKRLTGYKTIIYETYLEMKSGFRILWTKHADSSLLIWYVAKHKDVSRLARLIDDAARRSRRQLLDVSNLLETEQRNKPDKEDVVLLDPCGNTPLKLYEVRFDQIDELADANWRPRLHLTAEEREIVETPGSVLVLGRSGTGKTLCICNRMEYDRQRNCLQKGFSQLFVARSPPLRNYVKNTVGEASTTTFSTFQQLVRTLEISLLPSSKDTVDLSRKMDFKRYKRELHLASTQEDVDALTVWTSIRTFIKGSIEALKFLGSVLPEAEYLGLGKRRCRLSTEQRASVYKAFERYRKYMKDNRLWDDCDRIALLLRRFDAAQSVEPALYCSKVYVDEVQDYTQAEIFLVFRLCGPDDLFLAGDPAQSVVEGVEFRFEDIRSVGYHLCDPDDPDRRTFIPEKPKTVNVNFRSHSGILKTAAAVLGLLFQVFPDSAKQLKEDRGLFCGPRPAVYPNVETSRLQELILKLDGVVVLTHDENVSKWKQSLGGYPLVYGIREAKGLEFQSVILLDFFKDLPATHQKPWRDLLLKRDTSEFCRRHVEVEGQLKLLYVAITRCINRLFFAETSNSEAGGAFVRWIASRSSKGSLLQEALGVRGSVDTVEKMTMTPDEWRSAGLDNAIMAETTENLAASEAWLDKAEYCFQQIGDVELCSKARAHKSSIRLRFNLENKTLDNENDLIEIQVAQTLQGLLIVNLLLEVKQLCDSALPLLPVHTQEFLQRHLISRLPQFD